MYRASAFYFFALLLLAVPAFWPSYLFPKRYETDWHVHLHGIAMLLWMLMLIAQAGLVRIKSLAAHRALGRTSFVLVPVIVASTLLLAHYRMRSGLNDELIYFFYVQLALLVQFLVAYGLAILNRRAPKLHMRFMVCTALALVDPILARILANHFGVEPPVLQLLTYGVIDLILCALIVHDRIQQHYTRIYPAMLSLFVATQAPTFFVLGSKTWRGFTEAFARLPLP
ncbi:hypothetical protein [Usitatibacter palustris]|uniref:DUF2306 domain-containing protein n=1 Tax=Usitatibacter palustris TaxID=2732487 RepID=A0A6M4H636_9PROT|nr:hypothetical protein [Usitatibacter palustris]QJR15111.1 hypothetical protein DSM104440_01928 [Usitatibacter palustris]